MKSKANETKEEEVEKQKNFDKMLSSALKASRKEFKNEKIKIKKNDDFDAFAEESLKNDKNLKKIMKEDRVTREFYLKHLRILKEQAESLKEEEVQKKPIPKPKETIPKTKVKIERTKKEIDPFKCSSLAELIENQNLHDQPSENIIECSNVWQDQIPNLFIDETNLEKLYDMMQKLEDAEWVAERLGEFRTSDENVTLSNSDIIIPTEKKENVKS